ncbi:hypothetical protein [Mannheimia bovis]|uniref:hypothetical protein n=1 Tax=Mannheimia bovis TaxID=2770636 RepID=UPI001FC8C848|nr:hypothetical protein [Mannheimia bovis]
MPAQKTILQSFADFQPLVTPFDTNLLDQQPKKSDLKHLDKSAFFRPALWNAESFYPLDFVNFSL